MQRLEPVTDLLLGLAEDLAPDPLPVGAVAERDRSHVPVLRRSEVDRVLTTTGGLTFVSAETGNIHTTQVG